MSSSGSRLAHIFIWKEGTAPDLQYAQQALGVVNPEAAVEMERSNVPVQLFGITGPWPDDPWARGMADMQRAGANAGDYPLTDTAHYDLSGWQGTDRRTGEHIFVVTAYRRAAPLIIEDQQPRFTGEGLAPPAFAEPSSPAQQSRPQIPYYPERPTGPLAWPPAGETGPDRGEPPALQAGLHDSYAPFYVGFGPRVVAGLVDFFFMSLFQVGALGSIIAASASEQPAEFGSALLTYGLYTGLAVLIFSAYHVIQWSIWGQTFGKKLVGIKVVAANGDAPGWGRSLLRMVGYLFSLSLGGWGIVMIALDPRRQALHDKIAETFVVPEKATVHAPAGLPGYRDPGPAGVTAPPRPSEQMPAPALGMANVAAPPPYSQVQIAPAEGVSEPGLPQPTNLERGRDVTQPALNEVTPVTGDTEPVAWPATHTHSTLTEGEGAFTIPNLERINPDLPPSVAPAMPAPHFVHAPDTIPSLVSAATLTPDLAQARTFFKTGLAEMEAGVRPNPQGNTVEPASAREAAELFRQALEMVPGSVIYRYFYAVALRYSEGFDVAIGELKRVLEQDPSFYEARQQVAYGPRWHDAFAYPAWVSPAPVGIGAPIPGPIRSLLPPMQPGTRLVLLREGGTKIAAFLSRTLRITWKQLPTVEMRATLKLFLSRTPHGPIVALYILVMDDEENPYIGETFLNPYDPEPDMGDAGLLGRNMLAQLARQDRTYLIFADENDRLLLSRKLVFEAATQVEIARVLYEAQNLPSQVMDQAHFAEAAQWHIEHFSLDQLR